MSYPGRPVLEAGRATVEFLVGAIVLFVPLTVFALVINSTTQAQLAVEAAARHGARVFVQHTSVSEAVSATEQAVRHSVNQYGLPVDPALDIRCRPSSCLQPDSWVDVRVRVAVPVVRIPLLPHSLPATVTLSADSSQQVSRYRGDP